MPKSRGKPFPKGGPGGPGRKKGVPNKAKLIAEDIARSILEQPEAIAKLQDQARSGKLHPVVWNTLAAYAWGKPVDQVRVQADLPALVIKLSDGPAGD